MEPMKLDRIRRQVMSNQEADKVVQYIETLEGLARKLAEAGPFYEGIDDDFCAVCDAYFLIGQDHKDDCAYIALCRLLNVSPEEADE